MVAMNVLKHMWNSNSDCLLRACDLVFIFFVFDVVILIDKYCVSYYWHNHEKTPTQVYLTLLRCRLNAKKRECEYTVLRAGWEGDLAFCECDWAIVA